MNAGTARRSPAPLPVAPWATPAVQRSRRRFRAINLATTLPLFIAVGAVAVVRQAQSWQDGLVLGLGIVAVVVAFERWTVGEIGRVAVPCLAVGAVVWPYGALLAGSEAQAAYYALAVVGGLAVPQMPRRRAVAAGALVGYVAAIGTLGLVLSDDVGTTEVITALVVPTGVTAVLIGVMFPNQRFYDVVAEVEEAREREAELAVVRERVRFAGDLHDIQGHTLHVVKLKIALAQKLLHSDTARVEKELREMYALVGDTIAQTKDLAYGQRTLNLTAELENARNLLEAAGIRVRVERHVEGRPGESATPDVALLAQALRETTTNILRHSRATLVRVEVSTHGITVVNDGVADDSPPELRGLAALARRVSDSGGELTARLTDARFVTSVTFPPAPGEADR
ncbi:histidine kinase [Myceligenerans cantabricum]